MSGAFGCQSLRKHLKQNIFNCSVLMCFALRLRLLEHGFVLKAAELPTATTSEEHVQTRKRLIEDNCRHHHVTIFLLASAQFLTSKVFQQ